MILCGFRRRAALVLLASAPFTRRNFGMGTRWFIGQDAAIATVVRGEPCRIMARVSGWAVSMMAVRVVGTSGRRFR